MMRGGGMDDLYEYSRNKLQVEGMLLLEVAVPSEVSGPAS
jgi:hypothetical protein